MNLKSLKVLRESIAGNLESLISVKVFTSNNHLSGDTSVPAVLIMTPEGVSDDSLDRCELKATVVLRIVVKSVANYELMLESISSNVVSLVGQIEVDEYDLEPVGFKMEYASENNLASMMLYYDANIYNTTRV